MLQRLSQRFNAVAEQWMPDPFLFALALTAVTFVLGTLLTDSGPGAMIDHWRDGFWSLLSFGMQMCLILLTGYALADAPAMRRGIGWLAARPASARWAVAQTALATMLAGYVNWGLGLIVGAFLARETAIRCRERGILVDYPLLGASGYLGLLVWHGGLSGSAPLKVAEPGHSLVALSGVLPVSETLLSWMNLLVALALLMVLPWLCAMMHPEDAHCAPITDSQAAIPDEMQQAPATTPARQAERSPALTLLAMVFFLWALGRRFALGGLDLNSMNMIFLGAGMALHGNPQSYLRSFTGGTQGASGIILQFPFYGGIAGMMSQSGLVEILATTIEAISPAALFPAFAFVSAGIVNFFVPSGGGQWVVQGPLLLQAGTSLGLEPARIVMALAYGDQWTNMLQPFWALALLGVTGLEARQIVGYTALLFLASGPIFLGGLLLLPL